MVTVKVLLAQNRCTPVRIACEVARSAIDRTPTGVILQKNAAQARHNLLRHLVQRHIRARAGGTLHLEGVSIVKIELMQSAQQHKVDGKPDWPAPVRVAAKQ